MFVKYYFMKNSEKVTLFEGKHNIIIMIDKENVVRYTEITRKGG